MLALGEAGWGVYKNSMYSLQFYSVNIELLQKQSISFRRLMRVSQKDTGSNLKELPIAKAGKIWVTK